MSANLLIYICLGTTIITFLTCLYAIARVGNLLKTAKGLDWEQLTLLTGEIASVKRSIMNVSNRLNGMNKGSLVKDLELVREAEIQKEIYTNGKGLGG